MILSAGLINFSMFAMEKKPSKLTIDFTHVTREGLNNFARERKVSDLTPRSFESLINRCRELNINRNSTDSIAAAISKYYSISTEPKATICLECVREALEQMGKTETSQNNKPTLDFSAMGKGELNDFALEKKVEGVDSLTPRSYNSLVVRCKSLGITPDSDDAIAKTLNERSARIEKKQIDLLLQKLISAQANQQIYIITLDNPLEQPPHIAIPVAPEEDEQGESAGYLPAWAQCTVQ